MNRKMPTPTAQEILDQVRHNRPRGWRFFKLDHAQRIVDTLNGGVPVGCYPVCTSNEFDLTDDTIARMADQVRRGSRPDAVGFGVSTLIAWLAWKLIETAVWWAIQWAWRKEWGIENG